MTESPAADTRTIPALSDRSPAAAGLKDATTRLARLLQDETNALRQRRPVDLDDLGNRKNQLLLELTRIGRGPDRETLDPELRRQFDDLRDKLVENRSMLDLHLRAVRDVADILATAIRDAESDGTYSTPRIVVAGT